MITNHQGLYRQVQVNSVHGLVLDLRKHKAHIYWLDFMVSTSIFWIGVLVLARETVNFGCSTLIVTICVLALYRSALFLHEISHLPHGVLIGFEFTWNITIGWPLLFPSFFIYSHHDHHRTSSFGTSNDPEYFPFASAPRIIKIWFIFGSALTPFILLIRALLIVPCSWVLPNLRKWLRSRASRMTMNSRYQPHLNSQPLTTVNYVNEFLITILAWVWIAAANSYTPVFRLALITLTCAIFANILNAWRTLHAHAYISTGKSTDFLGQLQDTKNFTSPAFVGEFFAPVGQRFHATHHLFPYLPYHSLAEADRRIKQSKWIGKNIYLRKLDQSIHQTPEE
jgi:fatty acid desaturase